MNKFKNILYIGSGPSATMAKEIDLSKYTVCCANNAWRLFEDSHFFAWIHSGDFPKENFPKQVNYELEINNNDYEKTSIIANKLFDWNTKSPPNYLGYTIFFLGLYWIMTTLRPEKISLLGFDHDYNPEKIKKWEEHDRPNVQNFFNNKQEKNLQDWGNNFFKGLKQDFFYGHGTPDPMRYPESHLIKKFKIAQQSAEFLNIDLGNLSPVISEINILKKH